MKGSPDGGAQGDGGDAKAGAQAHMEAEMDVENASQGGDDARLKRPRVESVGEAAEEACVPFSQSSSPPSGARGSSSNGSTRDAQRRPSKRPRTATPAAQTSDDASAQRVVTDPAQFRVTPMIHRHEGPAPAAAPSSAPVASASGAAEQAADEGVSEPVKAPSGPRRVFARQAVGDVVREVSRKSIPRFVRDIVKGISNVKGLNLADVDDHDIKLEISMAIESAARQTTVGDIGQLAKDGPSAAALSKVGIAVVGALGGAAALAREKECEDLMKNLNTHMQNACKDGDSEMLARLLEMGASRPNGIGSREYVNLINTARLHDNGFIVNQLLDSLKPAKHDNLAIRLAAKFGLAATVRELLQLPEVQPQAVEDAAIILACEFGHHDVVQALIKDPRVNPAARNDCPLRWGAQHGNIAIVNTLLADDRVDPTACENFAIRQASIRGHDEVVEKLLSYPNVNPAAKDNRAIRLASANGHYKVVALLLSDPRVDPGARDNIAIQRACKNGFSEVVELLLKSDRVNPAVAQDTPIIKAAKHGQIDVLKMLLRDKRVNPANQNNTAVLEALNRGNLEAVRILITRKEVQRSARASLPSDKFANLTRIYEEMVAKAEPLARRALAWHDALQRGSLKDHQLPQRVDLISKIVGLAFGRELIVSREEGDGTTIDKHTHVRAERLVSRLINSRAAAVSGAAGGSVLC